MAQAEPLQPRPDHEQVLAAGVALRNREVGQGRARQVIDVSGRS